MTRERRRKLKLRDGDYHGIALNRAARLIAIAHGSQIVVRDLRDVLVESARRSFDVYGFYGISVYAD